MRSFVSSKIYLNCF